MKIATKKNIESRMNIHQKIDLIVERLEGYRLHNPQSAKLSYSGGRDSHLLLHIVRNVLRYSNSEFEAVYARTFNEFKDINDRILEQDVTMIDSGNNCIALFEKYGVAVFSKDCSQNIEYARYEDNEKGYIEKWTSKQGTQWDYRKQYAWANEFNVKCSAKCCIYLKDNHLKDAKIVGFRKSEKGRRNDGSSKNYEICVRDGKNLFRPIHDVNNSELAEMERVLGIENPNIYNYLDRTGCVMCGFGTKKQIKEKINYLRWYEPSRAKFYIKYFDKYLKFRKII